jgi:hypothetical protein
MFTLNVKQMESNQSNEQPLRQKICQPSPEDIDEYESNRINTEVRSIKDSKQFQMKATDEGNRNQIQSITPKANITNR